MDVGWHSGGLRETARHRFAVALLNLTDSQQKQSLKKMAKAPEQKAREDHRGGQRQDPSHRKVADCRPLQA